MKFSTGMAGKKEASALCKDVCAVRERLGRHELLAEPLEAAFKEVLSQLSDLLCPYPVEKLDRRVKELDEKDPDWVHGYVRCGPTVTWFDQPRSPEHPLWNLYPH
jgi:hypothetical protein